MSGMELSCGSAIKSLTLDGHLVGSEAAGFGLSVYAADTSPQSTHPKEGGGVAVIVIGSHTLHGRQSREIASCCEPSASAAA